MTECKLNQESFRGERGYEEDKKTVQDGRRERHGAGFISSFFETSQYGTKAHEVVFSEVGGADFPDKQIFLSFSFSCGGSHCGLP